MNHVAGSLKGELLYFGKVPSRGDFIRSALHPAFVDHLDRWQSQVMERLAADPRWKLVYDEAPAVAFSILGSSNRLGLAGHWLPSSDTSGRRFPFVAASVFDLPAARGHMALVPQALQRLWPRVEQVCRVAHAATAMEHAQASLNTPLDAEVDLARAALSVEDFLDSHTLASLEQMLQAAAHPVSLRQALMALGLLLGPAMAQGAGRLNKLLCLPLPGEPSVQGGVAAFWLQAVLGFFERHDLELGLFIVGRGASADLLVGFQGASAIAMLAAIDPMAAQQHTVTLDGSEWVEQEVLQDAGLRKLSNYLRDPGLSLSQALQIYREVFLGV